MKKTLTMLLVLVMLFSLCACSNSDNQPTDLSDSNLSTTNGTENSTGNAETPTDGTEGTQAPSDEPTTAPIDEPTTAPTNGSTTQPATCSHSWENATCTAPKTCTKCGATEGEANGHNWKDATCTVPKTCTKCGVTNGSSTEHKYADGKCSTCGKEDIVNPKVYFNPVDYVSFEKQEHGIWIVQIFWDGGEYVVADALYVKTVDNPDWCINYIDYEGERYYATGGGGPSFTYRLTDTYIEFIDPGDEPCAKYALQHDGSLRQLESSWNLPSLFHKGTLDELLSKLN